MKQFKSVREIKKEIESFNNAVFLKKVLVREEGEVVGVEVHFQGTKFALEGIYKLFKKVIHVSYEGSYMIFKRKGPGSLI